MCNRTREYSRCFACRRCDSFEFKVKSWLPGQCLIYMNMYRYLFTDADTDAVKAWYLSGVYQYVARPTRWFVNVWHRWREVGIVILIVDMSACVGVCHCYSYGWPLKNSHIKQLGLKFWCSPRYMSSITLYTHRYIGLRNSGWAEISVFLMVFHDCTYIIHIYIHIYMCVFVYIHVRWCTCAYISGIFSSLAFWTPGNQ